MKCDSKNMKILCIGVGGAGTNVINRMKDIGIPNAEFLTFGGYRDDYSHPEIPHYNLIEVNEIDSLPNGSGAEVFERLANNVAEDIKEVLLYHLGVRKCKELVGYRAKDYYTAIHTPLYSEEKNAFEILEENYRCVRAYVYYFEEIPEDMSSVELLGGNAGAYIFRMDVCCPEHQPSNKYLQFADELNAKVGNGEETRFELGFFATDELEGVKMVLSVFVFNLREV